MKCNGLYLLKLYLLLNMLYICTLCEKENGYITRQFKDYIKNNFVTQFVPESGAFGNFTQFLNYRHYLFVISNGSRLVKLNSINLDLLEEINYNKCTASSCERFKINTIAIGDSFLWMCYYQVIHVFDYTLQQDNAACKFINTDQMSVEMSMSWTANYYTSSDFKHRTLIMYGPNNTFYSAYYLKDTKLLHISLNNVLFRDTSAKNRVVLHQSFFKGNGEFILSFIHKKSVYFLYRETDYLCSENQMVTQTRILKLCLNDKGIDSSKLSTYFTFFAKADVICYRQSSENLKQPKFLFQHATDGIWLPKTENLLVSFVSYVADIPISAACIYSISDIETAFRSKLVKDSPQRIYKDNFYPDICEKKDFKNAKENDRASINILSKTYPKRQLPISQKALYYKEKSKFLKLSADESQIDNDVKSRRINLYIGQVEGSVSSQLAQSSVLHLRILPGISMCIEKKLLLPETVTEMKHSNDNKKNKFLLIGTTKRVIRILLNDCKRFISKSKCIKETYCGWNKIRNTCSAVAAEGKLLEISDGTCSPVINKSDKFLDQHWINCTLFKATQFSTLGWCSCRYNSVKALVEVSSTCHVNGEWTPYTNWSLCSASCGMGNVSRTRSCSFPLTQGNGRYCDGKPIQFKQCQSTKPCEDKSVSVSYTLWSNWSPCSQKCGFSIRNRTRKCKANSKCNESELKQIKLCNKEPCIISKQSEWSKWSTEKLKRKKLKFTCQKPYFTDNISNIKLTVYRTNAENACAGGKSIASCLSEGDLQAIEGEVNTWSSWSECNVACGIGYQFRHRLCNKGENKCFGSVKDVKVCQKPYCTSSWSCWNEWSSCPTKCETSGVSRRTRRCKFDNQGRPCPIGMSKEEKECPVLECPSHYTKWSGWSTCLDDGLRKRKRKCRPGKMCTQSLLNVMACFAPVRFMLVKYSSVYLIVSALVGFLAGLLVAGIICYIWFRCLVDISAGSVTVSTSKGYMSGEVVDSVFDMNHPYGGTMQRSASRSVGSKDDVGSGSESTFQMGNTFSPSVIPNETLKYLPPPQHTYRYMPVDQQYFQYSMNE